MNLFNVFDSNLVYSTDSGRIKETKSEKITPSDGFAKVRRETKGRKGKGVMTISGLGLDNKALKACAEKVSVETSLMNAVDTVNLQQDRLISELM